MSARDAFLDVLRSREMVKPGEEWVIDHHLRQYAHELAEQIRTNIGKTDYPGKSQRIKDLIAFGRAQADLIDPEIP